MSRLDQLIRQAETDLSNAQALPDSDESKAGKVTEAKARLQALRDTKSAADDEINDAVRTRIPSAETTAKEEERKRIAGILGIPVEQVTDEKLQEVKEAYQGRLSETEREKQAREAAETRATTLETENERNKRIAENARARHEDFLKRQAVVEQLLGLGVIHETGENAQSYLDLATDEALKNGNVTVEVEVDDDGNLNVKGEVQGAKEAAEKVKETRPALFGEGTQQINNPPHTPQDRRRQGGGGGSAYRPALSVTGPRQSGG